MDIKERQKLYVLFGIFGIALLIVYYNFLLRPQFSKFIMMNREYRAFRNKIKYIENLITNEDRIKKQYENLKRESELLERSFLGEEQISGILEDFSNVAESSGVKILKIKPLERIDGVLKGGSGVYSEFPILIEARAGYHQCGIFINKLENMDRFIKIDDVEISARPEDTRHHYIKLKVATYVLQ